MPAQTLLPALRALTATLLLTPSLSALANTLSGDRQPLDNPPARSALSGWTFGYSPYTLHYSDAKQENAWEPEEQKHAYVWLLQAEKALEGRSLAGLAVFSNSFGQPTQYAYYGWRFHPMDSVPELYTKFTAGVIHGYKYPYDKKIPLNHRNGWGLTVIPAVGYQFTPQWSAQLNVLGSAGLMFQVNYTVR